MTEFWGAIALGGFFICWLAVMALMPFSKAYADFEAERLDTEEDLAARERMLDEVERSFYEHEGLRLGVRRQVERKAK